MRGLPSLGRNLLQRVARPLDHGFDKARMIEERSQFVNLRRALTGEVLSRGDVLAILTTARVAAECGGEKGDCPVDAVGLHLRESIRQQGGPIAVAKVERQFDASGRELVLQSCQQLAVLSIDGADAAEMIIV